MLEYQREKEERTPSTVGQHPSNCLFHCKCPQRISAVRLLQAISKVAFNHLATSSQKQTQYSQPPKLTKKDCDKDLILKVMSLKKHGFISSNIQIKSCELQSKTQPLLAIIFFHLFQIPPSQCLQSTNKQDLLCHFSPRLF